MPISPVKVAYMYFLLVVVSFRWLGSLVICHRHSRVLLKPPCEAGVAVAHAAESSARREM
jgi:hypothetical protein